MVMVRGRTSRLMAITLAGALLLAGCSPAAESQPSTSSAAATTADPALADFYGQSVSWEPCPADGKEYDCAEILVPMDYDNPDRETILIALTRYSSAGPNAPAMLLNPGGPGGSGTDMVTWMPFLFSQRVLEQYNLIGFDPRGVQTSAAVECLPDADLDTMLGTDWDLNTPEQVAAYEANVRELAAKCQAATGPLLEFVDTDSAARDMDIIREVTTGRPELNFFGFSYGTFLGAVYAGMFPERVGRFVLDAALDPALSMEQLAMGQAMGFDRAVRSYMDDCLTTSECWHQGTAAEGLGKITALIEQAKAQPLPTGDPNRPLTKSYALSGVLVALYSVFYWGKLTESLDQAINHGDGTGLLELADIGNSRNPDGTFDGNANEAFMPITCLDYPVNGTLTDWQAAAAAMAEQYPVFGDALAYSELTCSNWPYASKRVREPIAATGSNPILVVGTTRDPATPYEWAQSLAEQLDNAGLLTWDGDGHAAYGNSACINSEVDEYLLTGDLPAAGTVC